MPMGAIELSLLACSSNFPPFVRPKSTLNKESPSFEKCSNFQYPAFYKLTKGNLKFPRLKPFTSSSSSSQIESFTVRASASRNLSIKSKQELNMKDEGQIPLISLDEAIESLNTRNFNESTKFEAMYSSVYGGITKDLAAMVLPIDDHMVHRGHGVFDTALIRDGHLYELDEHVDRLLRSANDAKILPPFSREELRNIIIQTTAVSGVRDGHARYWLSAGPGGFALSTKECTNSTFYVIILGGYKQKKPSIGVKVITSSIPIKPKQFATMKNVNYLPNALVLKEAEENDAFAGIWLDNDGFVGEGPSMNVAFVTQDDILLIPEFDQILAGCTMKRVAKLAQNLLNSSHKGSHSPTSSPTLNGIEIRKVTLEEAKSHSKEMMLVGSGVQVEPVIAWDDVVYSQGKPGPVAKALRLLLEEDMVLSPQPLRVPVPYR